MVYQIFTVVMALLFSIITAYVVYRAYILWSREKNNYKKEIFRWFFAGVSYLLVYKILLDVPLFQQYWQAGSSNVVVAKIITNALFVLGITFILYAGLKIKKENKN